MECATDRHGVWLAAGMLWGLLVGLPAAADDTELFVVDSAQFPQSQPNVLLILDNSGSMGELISTQPLYDSSIAYGGSCSGNRVYWKQYESGGDNAPPTCGTDDWVEQSAFTCQAALDAFATAGFYTDRMGQYDGDDERWERLDDDYHERLVECEDDEGLHGDGIDGDALFAQNGDSGAPWSAASSDAVSWSGTPLGPRYTTYDGNYLNWYYDAPHEDVEKIDIVKDVATSLLDTVNGINVGLMQFNHNSNGSNSGGAVIHAVEDISTARTSLKDIVDGIQLEMYTPLAETLYEAHQYFRGGSVVYGDGSSTFPSVPESRNPVSPSSTSYGSPVEFACQKNFVIYLSDGEPTNDDAADDDIESLIGGNCSGNCLDELAGYLYEGDLSPVDHDGRQNAVTHTIGFDIDLPLLSDAAEAGGGQYFQANNTAELSVALSNIVSDILDTQTTFTSPTVSINSFNQTQNLNDLYIAMFEPSGDVHWPGNLKKYRLRPSDSVIVDADGQPAVDGAFFSDTARSFWSDEIDGAGVTRGGAANELPDPSVRDVYTCLDCTTGRTGLSDAGNRVEAANTALDDARLDIESVAEPTRSDLIDFIRGVDVANGGGARNQMGDPLHAQAATVTYDEDESVVYFATNDGYLHAIDTEDGSERWSFIPEEFLGDMAALYYNESVADKHYGIDGSLRVQVLDTDGNGAIDGSDRVYLFFGMRRGGDTYYALDVTDPEDPEFLWKKSSGDLPLGVGQSWSNPVPTRVDVADGTYGGTNGANEEKLALVFGAGYDPGHDQPGRPGTPDEGNGIVILDAVNGNLLWHVTAGGGDMTGTTMPNMQYSFAGDIRVVDLDGNRFADRMYAADMGGQVWRFDVFNSRNRAELVHGGVIAQLAGASTDPYHDVRRFYYAPDAAFVSNGANSFMHIGIGSGHRASPNSTSTQDRFYALRDHSPFTFLTQAQFNAREADPITEADLVDIRDDVSPTLSPGAAGWRMELRVPETGTWNGEKVLAEARTFDNAVYFTTFTPGSSATANDCEPRLGTNRLYIVDLLTGAPITNLDGVADDDELTYTDRYTEVGGSIASEVVFLFPSPEDPDECVGDECRPAPVACVDLFCFPPGFGNAPVRTFWNQDNLDE